MPEYNRRPMKVTAFQFDGSQEMAQKLHRWYISCKGSTTPMFHSAEELKKAIEDPNRKPSMSYDSLLGVVSIATPSGAIELSTGDWMVQTPGHDFLKMTHEDFTEEHSPILKPVDA